VNVAADEAVVGEPVPGVDEELWTVDTESDLVPLGLLAIVVAAVVEAVASIWMRVESSLSSVEIPEFSAVRPPSVGAPSPLLWSLSLIEAGSRTGSAVA